MTVQVKASADNTYGALQVNGIDKVYFGKTGDNLEALTNSTLASYSQRSLTAAVATTSGTAIDFTGIPSWAKKVSVLLNNVSTNGTSVVEVRIGTSSGIESTGYSSNLNIINTSTVGSIFSATGIPTVTDGLATYSRSGSVVLALQDSANNVWVYSGLVTYNPSVTGFPAGRKNLAGQLDRIRITTVNGTDTFDAGSVSLLIEG